MEDKITIELTKKEYVLLVKRYETSLEKDAERERFIEDDEFALLKKLVSVKENKT